MLNIPLYGKQKLLLAFEFGLLLSEVSKTKGVEMTPDLVARAERILMAEFTKNSPTTISVDMIVNILAAFEPK